MEDIARKETTNYLTFFLTYIYRMLVSFIFPFSLKQIPLANTMGLQMHMHAPWRWQCPLHLLLQTFLLLSYHSLVLDGAAHLSNETDRQALLSFKAEISIDPHQVLSSWNASLHFCLWPGISCGHRHQRVTAINLSTLGLVGRISPHLANLSFLKTVTLPNNSLHGEIPQEISSLFRLQHLNLAYNSLEGAIPARLSNCSNLRFMNLHHNKLVGEVPPEFGLLSKLTEFQLAENNLTGVFPHFLVNLSSVSRLSLASNNFYGVIPGEVGLLYGLEALLLGGNNFFGKLPPTVYNLSKIKLLAVEQNQLSGSISPHMGYIFPNLQLLSVHTNHFTGSIPNSLCNASHLQVLALNENHFHGSIPIDLGKLQELYWVSFFENKLGNQKGDDLHFITSLANISSLETLLVQENQLNGPLPASISNLSSNLIRLSLGSNRIYGRIPSGIENLFNLEFLDFHGNFLTGPILDGIGKLPILEGLYLGINRLSGQIPVSLGNLSHLSRLYLSKNYLQGSVPPSLGNISGMQYLDLSKNNLNGDIPSQLFQLRSILHLYLSSNLFSGSLPSEVGQLQNMNFLDLSNNKLSGEIPNALGKCRMLIEIYMSHNSFAGAIPMSLKDLSVAAECVDFSNNNLSGTIPTYFTEFTYLQLLNLSFNNLEGEVPEQGSFRNASKISVIGNKKLCGGIFELHLPSCQKHGRKKSRKSFPLKIVLPLIVGTCTFIFTCYIFVRYWRKRRGNEQSLTSSIKEQHMKITYVELHRATNGFCSVNLIGAGSFGSVYKGTSYSYQMDIAVKVIRIEHRSLKSFTAECEALKTICHRNIVKILTSCSSLDFQGNEFKALVFKFMPNGNLDSWLHPHVDQDLYLSFNKRLDVAIDIAHALDYLHNHCGTPIVHCDLKPNNILLDEDHVAHVSDFGLAKILLFARDYSSYTSMLKGSIGYIPPEYGIGCKVTTQGDVYSYGIILLEMFSGKRPTDEMFNDGVNIAKHAQMALKERLIEIVDPTLLSQENITDVVKFEDCLLSVFKIGIACATDLPQDRKNIRDVCTELQLVREAYHKPMLRQRR